MRLILALVSPDSGNVVFYDCEGNKAEASPLTRRNLSYVPQGNTLFSGTIRDNLRMGNPDAGDEEYSRAFIWPRRILSWICLMALTPDAASMAWD